MQTNRQVVVRFHSQSCHEDWDLRGEVLSVRPYLAFKPLSQTLPLI